MPKVNPGLALLLIFSAAGSCSRHEPSQAAKQRNEPVAVRVETVQPSERSSTYDAIGTVRAVNSAQIASRIPSYIQRIHVDVGNRVQQGQLLVELDDRDLASHLEQAKAAKTEVQDAIDEAAQGLVAAQAQLELAQVTHKRYEDLLQKKSVSQHEYDGVVARLRGAAAAVEMAQARRRQAEAKQAQAEAQIVTANVGLGYARIEAPFAGVVTERRMDAGSLATPGMPILVIEQAAGYRLEADLPETRLATVRVGETVAVRLDAIEKELQGRVVEVVPSVDAESRTTIVRISLPPLAGLRSGMFGRALFVAAGEMKLTIPQGAVMSSGQLQSVFVVEGDVARRRLVSLGSLADGRYAVLSGLDGGEQVVLDPEKVSDGGAVRVSELVAEPRAAIDPESVEARSSWVGAGLRPARAAAKETRPTRAALRAASTGFGRTPYGGRTRYLGGTWHVGKARHAREEGPPKNSVREREGSRS